MGKVTASMCRAIFFLASVYFVQVSKFVLQVLGLKSKPVWYKIVVKATYLM